MKNKSEVKLRFKKIKNIIEYIVVFLVIFINIFLIFQSVQNPYKTPSLFGRKAFIIISGSMIPKIQIGDVVVTKNANDYVEGDIIAFRKDSSVIVHRIVKEMDVNGQRMFQTKGDNNNVEDKELVAISTIEGKMIFKIPLIGKVLMWMYKNLFIVIAILLVILIIKFYFSKK